MERVNYLVILFVSQSVSQTIYKDDVENKLRCCHESKLNNTLRSLLTIMTELLQYLWAKKVVKKQ
jgi:hypothetical protein